jgi:hypothetical protein
VRTRARTHLRKESDKGGGGWSGGKESGREGGREGEMHYMSYLFMYSLCSCHMIHTCVYDRLFRHPDLLAYN